MMTFLEIRPKNPRAKESIWFNEEEFCHFHFQKGHDTNKWITLKNVVQDLIDNGKLEVDNPIAIPNKNLGIYQNPLSLHVSLHSKQVTYNWIQDNSSFISMISVATRS